MLSLHGLERTGGSFRRREWLRVSGLSGLGLSLPTLLNASQLSAASVSPPNSLSGDLGGTFGKAKNVILLWLQGGPPQHETFDPKPDAPLEIRGPFKPIHTNVPGIQFSELLPRTARYADKLCGCDSDQRLRGYRASLCPPLVVLQEPTQSSRVDNVVQPNSLVGFQLRPHPRRQMAAGLVRVFPIVMQPQFPVDVVQVPLAHNHELVKEFRFQALHEPFDVRPHVG